VIKFLFGVRSGKEYGMRSNIAHRGARGTIMCDLFSKNSSVRAYIGFLIFCSSSTAIIQRLEQQQNGFFVVNYISVIVFFFCSSFKLMRDCNFYCINIDLGLYLL
jgi:hypothetical protein